MLDIDIGPEGGTRGLNHEKNLLATDLSTYVVCELNPLAIYSHCEFHSLGGRPK